MRIEEMLKQPKIWVESFHRNGVKANFAGMNLTELNLIGINLLEANLSTSYLRRVDLSGDDLPKSISVIMGKEYFILIVGNCVSYLIEEWSQVSKYDLLKLDGITAVRFNPRLLDIIDFYYGKGDRPKWLKEKEQNNKHKKIKQSMNNEKTKAKKLAALNVVAYRKIYSRYYL